MGAAFSSTIGDSYDQVIAEKGNPVNHLEAGTVQILTYPDATIKLRDNVVVSVEASVPAPHPSYAAPAPHPAPASAKASASAKNPEAPGGPVSWGTNYALALEQAKNEHKHVFLFFTGSDWCGWCKKLEKDVLTTNEFVQYAQAKLVMVELDYPHKKALPDELRAQNSELQGKFDVRGFPTVIILDSAGKQVSKMVGYQKGGPGPFVSRIQSLGD